MRTLLLTFGFWAAAYTGYGQTADSLVSEALLNNPSVLASYHTFEAEMQRVSQVNSLPDPQLSVGIFIQPVETRVGPQRARISISQMFPWFGTLRARGDAASLRAEAAYEEFLNQKLMVTRDVKLAYFDWLEWSGEVEILERDIELLRRILRVAEARSEAGTGSLAEVLRLQIQVEDVTSRLTQLRLREPLLISELRTQINRPDSLSIEPEHVSLETFGMSLNWPADSLVLNHPRVHQILALQHSERSREESVRRSGYPSFGVGVDYVAVGPRTDMAVPGNGSDAIMPMFTISLPVFRSKYNAGVREAQLRQSALASRSEQVVSDLKNDLHKARYNWESGLEDVRRLEANVDRAESTLRLLETAYEADGADFNGVLEVEEILLSYQLEALNAKTEVLKTTARMEYLMGENINR